MSKYTLIIKKDARKYRTPLFETNNNTIGLEMQQKEVKICGGVGRRAGGRLQHRKKFATRGRFRYDKRVGIWYVYLTYRYPYAVCCSGSAHGTQNFPPFYSFPETTFPDLIEKFI